MSLGKCILSSLWHNIAHPLRGLTFKWLITLVVGEDVEELELSYTTGGNVKWYNHFGEQLCGFLKDVYHTI